MDFTSKTHPTFTPLHQANSSSPFTSSKMLFTDHSSPFEIPHGFCRSSQSTPDKRPNDHPSSKSTPRVHHIPIHIEGRESPDHRSSSPFTPPPNSNFTSEATEVPVTRVRSYSNSSNQNLSRSPSAASDAASHTSQRSFSSASVDSNNNTTNESTGKKIRQIPITLEYDPHDTTGRRSGHSFGVGHSRNTPSPAPQYSSSPRTNSFASGPHVTNIPVNVRRSNNATAFNDAYRDASPKPETCQQTPPVARSPAPKTPMDLIDEANKKLADLKNEISQFTGDRDSKQYRYYDEMLTRLLISCDDIDTQGDPNIRTARKGVVNDINACIAFLESKTKGNQTIVEETEKTDETASLQQIEPMEDVVSDAEKTDKPKSQQEEAKTDTSDEPMQAEAQDKMEELMIQEPYSTQGEMKSEPIETEEVGSTEAVITSTSQNEGQTNEASVKEPSVNAAVAVEADRQVTEAAMADVSDAMQASRMPCEKEEKEVTNDPEITLSDVHIEDVPNERSEAITSTG